jgi:hypothetical protein
MVDRFRVHTQTISRVGGEEALVEMGASNTTSRHGWYAITIVTSLIFVWRRANWCEARSQVARKDLVLLMLPASAAPGRIYSASESPRKTQGNCATAGRSATLEPLVSLGDLERHN